jgi:hypothetical protein
MPPLQTSYVSTMRAGLPGMPASMHDYAAASYICQSAGGIPFGVVVGQGGADKGAVIGGANPVGVSLRDVTIVHSDPAMLDRYALSENINVLTTGDIWVVVTAAVTPATAVTYDPATGALAPAAGGTALPGARFLTSAGAGQLAKLRVNMP